MIMSPMRRIQYDYSSVSEESESSSEQPDEVKDSTVEDTLEHCQWRECRTERGRAYYYNIDTNESRWLKPSEYKDLERQLVVRQTRAKSQP
ncbi:unnamed protein product [Didymodactylos carnosus]|uniref:WW domain-containing protein n=1 Tax=Didymodactylos carnosus TaxID=1234261 RepID=A0A815H2T8_9BILA|nr:unnamed protein product [Didymodactylos carnosus]CAF1348576.1 unnamed protein product [Didymodactylos carnosus]CAF3985331.1 unnamed protein product [Didymodactylos carnosus]CAF4216510.1 unnamed protein product [Didymodactylos carnosus]